MRIKQRLSAISFFAGIACVGAFVIPSGSSTASTFATKPPTSNDSLKSSRLMTPESGESESEPKNGLLKSTHPQPTYSLVRRDVLREVLTASMCLGVLTLVAETANAAKKQGCTDIDSCREIGEQRDLEDLQRNPIVRLPSGVQYKVLRPGTGTDSVKDGTILDLTYSISQASGSYMYSQGFGYEKTTSFDGKEEVNDLGLDSLRVQIGKLPRDVPSGIEEALLGMTKGEKRRVTVPPSAGFETSNWQPEPTTRRGKVQIKNYKSLLAGGGSSRPAFPAPTIWDISVERIRN